MALLLTSVFSATGCGSDDGEAPVESRIKNSISWSPLPCGMDDGDTEWQSEDHFGRQACADEGSPGAGEGYKMQELGDFIEFEEEDSLRRDAKLDRMRENIKGNGSSLNRRNFPWDEP